MIDHKLIEEKYGKTWAYFAPSNARPFHRISNSAALNPATIPLEARPFEIRDNELRTEHREIAVIQTYSCIANAAVPNPYWLGRLPTPLPPFAFQNRIQWAVLLNDGRQNDLSDLDGVTYQNTPAAPTPLTRSGKSLLQTYSVGNGAPPILVPPGQTAYIGIFAMPDLWGAETPPPNSPPIIFTTELIGYYIDLPGSPLPTSPQDVHSSAIRPNMRRGLV